MSLEISNDYERVGSLIFDLLVFLKWGEREVQSRGNIGEFLKLYSLSVKSRQARRQQLCRQGSPASCTLEHPWCFPRALSHCRAHPSAQLRRAEGRSHSHCPDHGVGTAQSQSSSQAEPGNQRAIHRDNKIQSVTKALPQTITFHQYWGIHFKFISYSSTSKQVIHLTADSVPA